ncbi:MAG: cobyrinate a,c-diamide synthase, partial [Lachnospiraceae bacterium]|nr:cobyrinate a,c-diamide synthase [Lachnospiraceae bacterium]
MGRIMIAGISSGCGKTTLVCGLLAVLKSRGLKVCSFNCGPDYIDPYFHRSVLGIPSYNLDPWFYDTDKLRHICNNMASDCDISVIEGAMGYYDGIGFSPKCSSYQVAAATQTPTVLVVDASGMGYSSIAMLEGFLHFKVTKQIDVGLNMDGGRGDNLIRGVIFNRMSKSLYQEAACIVRSLGIVPLGYLPRNNDISLNSRHLGLVMPDEDKYSLSSTEKKIQRIAELIGDTIDVDGLIELASLAEPLTNPPCHRFNNELTDKVIPLPPQYEKIISATCDECVHPLIDALSGKGPACKAQEQKLRIAVARDSAFCCFYPLDAMLLEQLGCELVYFSPVQGETLPKGICGLILPGGYPE